MKLTNEKLKQIIKEELESIMTEMEEESAEMMISRELKDLPNAGGSIMGTPGATARDELVDIANSLEDEKYLSQLANTVHSEEAKRVLEKLGYTQV